MGGGGDVGERPVVAGRADGRRDVPEPEEQRAPQHRSELAVAVAQEPEQAARERELLEEDGPERDRDEDLEEHVAGAHPHPVVVEQRPGGGDQRGERHHDEHDAGHGTAPPQARTHPRPFEPEVVGVEVRPTVSACRSPRPS